MTNIVYVLLFVLFPPQSVLAKQPDAQPLIQTVQTKDIEDCKTRGNAALVGAAKMFPGAPGVFYCLAIPEPQADKSSVPAPAQPDPDHAILAPGEHAI